MTNRKRKFIALLTILLSPIALATFYLLIHGTSTMPSKVELISFFLAYIIGIPIAIVIVLWYFKNGE